MLCAEIGGMLPTILDAGAFETLQVCFGNQIQDPLRAKSSPAHQK